MTSLSPPLQAVVALFRGPLQNVRFADIDAAGLSNLAQEVEGAAAEVEAHEAKLAEQRQLLAQKLEALSALAQQALAYARIYAEGDEALTAELNDIALPRASKPRKAAPAKPAARDGEPAAAMSEPSSENTAAEVAAAVEPSASAAAEGAEADDGAASAKPGRRKVQRRLGRPAAREDAV